MFPTLTLLTHSLSFCLFGRGKKNPPNSSLKSFLLLASISFSNLNTWWFDVTAFENRRLRALLLRLSATHPDGYLTEDVGTELAQNSRTSLLLHKGQKPTCREQCCSFRIRIKHARSHVIGGFLHADVMGNFYLPLYCFAKANIAKSYKERMAVI